MTMLTRFSHRIYAALHGYFWAPCPHCGRMFGGHEAGETQWTSPFGGRTTCNHPDCVAEMQAINARRWARGGDLSIAFAGYASRRQ